MVTLKSTGLLCSLALRISPLAGVACTQSLSSQGISHAHQSLCFPGFLFNRLPFLFNYSMGNIYRDPGNCCKWGGELKTLQEVAYLKPILK